MANPLRSDVHWPMSVRSLVEAGALSSIAIINNVPGPSPAGSASGSPGPRGFVGDTGPGIYSGYSDPPDSFGQLKDFWLNLETYVLFGPKTTLTRWPADGVALRGNRITQGHGPPTEPNPQAGDAYLDLDASNLYIAS